MEGHVKNGRDSLNITRFQRQTEIVLSENEQQLKLCNKKEREGKEIGGKVISGMVILIFPLYCNPI